MKRLLARLTPACTRCGTTLTHVTGPGVNTPACPACDALALSYLAGGEYLFAPFRTA